MTRLAPLFALGLLAALGAPAPAATPPKAGTYQLMVVSTTRGQVYGLVKITPKDDGVTGELAGAHPFLPGLELKGATLDGDTLRLVLKGQGGEMTFEGR